MITLNGFVCIFVDFSHFKLCCCCSTGWRWMMNILYQKEDNPYILREHYNISEIARWYLKGGFRKIYQVKIWDNLYEWTFPLKIYTKFERKFPHKIWNGEISSSQKKLQKKRINCINVLIFRNCVGENIFHNFICKLC